MLHSESNRRENLAKLHLRLQTHSWCSLELSSWRKMKSSKVVLYLLFTYFFLCVCVVFLYLSFFLFLFPGSHVFTLFKFPFLHFLFFESRSFYGWPEQFRVTKYQKIFLNLIIITKQFASPNSKKIVRMLLQTRTSNYSFNYLEQEFAWGNWLTQSHQEKVCHLSSNKKFSTFFTDNQLYAYFYSQ